MKILLTLIAILLIGNTLFAQSKKVETVVIQTSAQCEMCKERIEVELIYTGGVKKAILNLEDKSVSVTYKTKKLSADKIRKIVSDLGYDADEVKANQEAYGNLPECCKKAQDRTGKTEMD
jgi:copper chaperone CopZ